MNKWEGRLSLQEEKLEQQTFETTEQFSVRASSSSGITNAPSGKFQMLIATMGEYVSDRVAHYFTSMAAAAELFLHPEFPLMSS